MAMSTTSLPYSGIALGGLGIDVKPYFRGFNYTKLAPGYYRGARSDEHFDMVRFADPKKGNIFFDLGCGPGASGLYAAKLVGPQNVRFGDIELNMIKAAMQFV